MIELIKQEQLAIKLLKKEEVSTAGGPPTLFEALVFGGQTAGWEWRYSAWDEADASHGKVVEMVMEATDQ